MEGQDQSFGPVGPWFSARIVEIEGQNSNQRFQLELRVSTLGKCYVCSMPRLGKLSVFVSDSSASAVVFCAQCSGVFPSELTLSMPISAREECLELSKLLHLAVLCVLREISCHDDCQFSPRPCLRQR